MINRFHVIRTVDGFVVSDHAHRYPRWVKQFRGSSARQFAWRLANKLNEKAEEQQLRCEEPKWNDYEKWETAL